MPRTKKSLLTDLSTADLKRLLAARERIDVLERERSKLAADLAKVEKELGGLMADGGAAAPVRKVGRGKAARKKAARKKAATGKTAVRRTTGKKTVARQSGARKSAAKKATAKKATARKSPAKKTRAKKTPARKAGVVKAGRKAAAKSTAARGGKGAPRVKLEDVIVAVIKAHGGTMPFQELKKAIVKGKLFASKSSNFDNVLRRTLSTSDAVASAGRGIYRIA